LNALDEGTVTEIIGKLETLEPGIKNAQLVAITEEVLTRLYDRGMLQGTDKGGIMHYNLHKNSKTGHGPVIP
jgi:hypothetical protein